MGRVHFELERLPREAELLWVEMVVVLVVETLGGLRLKKGLDHVVNPRKRGEESGEAKAFRKQRDVSSVEFHAEVCRRGAELVAEGGAQQ